MFEIFGAVRNGNIAKVRELFQQGGDINEFNLDFLLHLAVTGGHIDVVRFLHEQGANLEARVVYDRTALHVAVEYGDIDMVRCLCELGADVGARCVDDRTALHMAVEYGNINMVRCLCEQGADVEAIDITGSTALHWATLNQKIDIIRFLLEAGARLDVVNHMGKSPIDLATKSECEAIVQLFKEHELQKMSDYTDKHLLLNVPGYFPGVSNAFKFFELPGLNESLGALLQEEGREAHSCFEWMPYDCMQTLFAIMRNKPVDVYLQEKEHMSKSAEADKLPHQKPGLR